MEAKKRRASFPARVWLHKGVLGEPNTMEAGKRPTLWILHRHRNFPQIREIGHPSKCRQGTTSGLPVLVRILSIDELFLTSRIDGGGTRSFSQLSIMESVMHRLKWEKYPSEPDKIMLPCEHFDLIGGSGTGGCVSRILTGR